MSASLTTRPSAVWRRSSFSAAVLPATPRATPALPNYRSFTEVTFNVSS